MGLVVVGHALIGVKAAGLADESARFAIIMIYTFHMPLFFCVSGLLAGRIGGKSWRAFSASLALKLVWPYLLWGFVLYTTHYVFSDHTNSELEVFEPLSILYSPPAVMWFLQILAVSLILWKLLAPVPKRVTLGLAVTVFVTGYWLPKSWQGLRFIGIFLAAAVIGRRRLEVAAATPGVAAMCLAVMALTAVPAWSDALDPGAGLPAFAPAYIPGALAGTLLMLRLSRLGTREAGSGPVSAWVEYIGRATMPIFVTHILFTAGTRIGLTLAGLDDPALIVLLGTLFGLAIPLAASAVAERLGVARILGWR